VSILSETANAQAAHEPLLHRIEPLPALRTANRLPVLLAMGVGSFLFALLSDKLGVATRAITPFASIETFVVFVAAIVATIAIHEIGHVIAGLIVRFEFVSMHAWPITVSRTRGKLRIRLMSPQQNMTVMLPPADFERVRERFAVFSAGGATANLTTFALVYPTVVAHGNPPSVFLYWVAFYSLFFGIVNLLPLRDRPVPSDGAQILDALAGNERFTRTKALLQLVRQQYDGKQVEACDPHLIEIALTPPDHSRQRMHACLYAYSARVKSDPAQAAPYLETALREATIIGITDRDALAAEAAIHFGYYCGDAELANAWASAIIAKRTSPVYSSRVAAAIAWAEHRPAEAIESLERLLRDPSIAGLPLSDAFEASCREWLGEMRSKTARA
jgi:hypothetical protein